MTKKLIVGLAFLLVSISAHCQKWSIGTNAVDWLNFGTINAEGSVAVARYVTVNAEYKFNPWTFNSGNRDTQLQNRQHTAKVGVRWWPWHIYSGWWFGSNLQYQEYNRGGVTSRKAEEGDAFGLDLSAGYTLMLHKHFNLEFGIGAWGGYTAFTEYECTRCGKIINGGSKWFVLPNEITVGVVWIF